MIKHGLLQIVEGLDEDNQVRRHFGAPALKEHSTSKGSRRRVPSWIVGALAGLAVALLAIVLIGPMLAPRPAEAGDPAESAAEQELIPSEEKQADEPATIATQKPEKERSPAKQKPQNAPQQQPSVKTQEEQPAETIPEDPAEPEAASVPAPQPKEEKKAGPGETEPNDDMPAAQTIGINQPVACYLGASGDVDCFQVNITQPGKYVVWMKNAAPSLAGVIDVYNERHLRLGRYTNRTPGAGHSASFRAQKTGMHYIRISARGGAGDYTLEVKPE